MDFLFMKFLISAIENSENVSFCQYLQKRVVFFETFYLHPLDLIDYVRKSFTCIRLNYSEPIFLEYICSELISFNKKWICYSIYRSPVL